MPTEDGSILRLTATEFRRRVSHWIAVAEAGRTIEVFRRGRPAVRITGVRFVGLHVGSLVGKGGIKPLLQHRGILESLWEDRGKGAKH
jgi:antitoxin (DNA-binding transcriptional repressor) of toxin-antitoxin stability system